MAYIQNKVSVDCGESGGSALVFRLLLHLGPLCFFCISGAFVYPATHDILSAHSLTSLFEELVVKALL